MTTNDFQELMHRLLTEAVDQSILDIDTASYINSKDAAVALLAQLQQHAEQMLSLKTESILDHFEPIGYTFYQEYHVPSFTWISLIERIKEDLLYAIQHGIGDYDDDELRLRINQTLNGLCRGYLLCSAEETLQFTYERMEAIDVEMDIMTHERWYRQLLQSITSKLKNLPELVYENSPSYEWIESLDFKLLMKATSFSSESNILILTHQLYDLGRKVIYLYKQQNFKDAYHFLTLLDQKINLLSDLLKEVLIIFNEDKLHYFFTLFSETILFEKQYSYFLTVTITVSAFIPHQRDVKRFFLEIYKQAKSDTKEKSYNFSGIIDDGAALHILMHYDRKSDIDIMLDLLQKSIERLQDKEIILIIPQFIVR
ncbi:MAG TPA: hypothetical protein ENG92_01470, partial [Thiolapillus brandeum]|nr:hypothetical protein [Thiolapillus brandeum]